MIWSDLTLDPVSRSDCHIFSVIRPALLDTLLARALDQGMNDLRSTYILKNPKSFVSIDAECVYHAECVYRCVCVCVCLLHVFWKAEQQLQDQPAHRSHDLSSVQWWPALHLCHSDIAIDYASGFSLRHLFMIDSRTEKLAAQQTPTFKRNDLLGCLSFNLKDWSIGGGGGITWSIASRHYSCTRW